MAIGKFVNRLVAGSNPARGAKVFKDLAERLKRQKNAEGQQGDNAHAPDPDPMSDSPRPVAPVPR